MNKGRRVSTRLFNDNFNQLLPDLSKVNKANKYKEQIQPNSLHKERPKAKLIGKHIIKQDSFERQKLVEDYELKNLDPESKMYFKKIEKLKDHKGNHDEIRKRAILISKKDDLYYIKSKYMNELDFKIDDNYNLSLSIENGKIKPKDQRIVNKHKSMFVKNIERTSTFQIQKDKVAKSGKAIMSIKAKDTNINEIPFKLIEDLNPEKLVIMNQIIPQFFNKNDYYLDTQSNKSNKSLDKYNNSSENSIISNTKTDFLNKVINTQDKSLIKDYYKLKLTKSKVKDYSAIDKINNILNVSKNNYSLQSILEEKKKKVEEDNSISNTSNEAKSNQSQKNIKYVKIKPKLVKSKKNETSFNSSKISIDQQNRLNHNTIRNNKKENTSHSKFFLDNFPKLRVNRINNLTDKEVKLYFNQSNEIISLNEMLKERKLISQFKNSSIAKVNVSKSKANNISYIESYNQLKKNINKLHFDRKKEMALLFKEALKVK